MSRIQNGGDLTNDFNTLPIFPCRPHGGSSRQVTCTINEYGQSKEEKKGSVKKKMTEAFKQVGNMRKSSRLIFGNCLNWCAEEAFSFSS